MTALQTEIRLIVGRLEDFAAKIDAGLEDSDWLSKREMIRALVKRVEVTPERVNVVFRVDSYPGKAGPKKKSLQLRRESIETQMGCSPSALGGVMQALETAILATTEAWEHDGVAAGDMREIIGAVDANPAMTSVTSVCTLADLTDR